MKDWSSFEQDRIDARSKNMLKWLKLPTVENILENMENKTKFRFIKNGPLAYVSGEARDKVFGFVIKNPGIMTRKYNKYINTEVFTKCPYCEEIQGNLIFH